MKGTILVNGIFREEIIKRKWGTKETVKAILFSSGFMILALVLCYVLLIFPVMGFMFPGFIAGGIWGAWISSTSMSVEYEYSVTDGYVVIEKITAQRKRKREIACELRDIDKIGKQDKNFKIEGYDTVIYADDHRDTTDNWYIALLHREFGKTLIIMSPSEQMVAAMKPFVPRLIAKEAFDKKY